MGGVRRALGRVAPGAWALALLSAAIVPLAILAAGAHRSHWAGAHAGAFWPTVVLPCVARAWAVLGAIALAGWASTAGADDPRPGRRLLLGLMAGATGAAIWMGAAAPTWIWLARIEPCPPGELVGLALRAALAPVVAAVIGGGAGGLIGPAGGWIGGGAAVGILWWGWGSLG